MTRTTPLTVLALLATTGAAHAQVAATFQFITDPNTGYTAFSANDMSPDGRWIVGSVDTDGDGFSDTGYRWDRVNDEFTYIDTGIIGTGVEGIQAVSDDGQVILGNIPGGPDGIAHEAGLWTEATGWTSIGFLPNALGCPSYSSAYELSADGTIATGLSWDGCSGRAFRWTQETGMVELQVLGEGGNRGSVMSADGSVIAGFAQGFTRTPAVWNGNTTTGELLDPTYAIGGEFHGISDDGSILLGTWDMGGSAFEAGMIVDGVESKIGDGALLPGWSGTPLDIADNGTIVGFDFLLGNRRAWIKPYDNNALILFETFIENLGAVIPDNTRFEVLQAISADGRVIIGHSFGQPAYVVTLEYECPADINDDGELDFFDVSAFLQALANAQPIADFNNDESYDFFDVSAFLQAMNAGCP